MLHIEVGTDTYGRVKTVGKTSVVTKFEMAQAVPVQPIKSYYRLGKDEVRRSGVAMLASHQETIVHGIPLQRLDRVSVAIAYVRALIGALTAVGSLAIAMGIDQLYNGGTDEFRMVIFQVTAAIFSVGVIGGLLTYVVPLTSKREREIRRLCGDLLGISVDPALMVKEEAQRIDLRAGNQALPDGRMNQLLTRNDCIRELISVRVSIAQGLDTGHLEAKTDKLLERLNHSPNV